VNSLRIRLNSFAEFFSSYSSGLFCSPEPFTFVSLLSLSLSLEATCLFYHFYAFLSTPFFAFCFFYTLFPFSYLFLSILLRSFVPLIQKVIAQGVPARAALIASAQPDRNLCLSSIIESSILLETSAPPISVTASFNFWNAFSFWNLN